MQISLISYLVKIEFRVHVNFEKFHGNFDLSFSFAVIMITVSTLAKYIDANYMKDLEN